jgi:hypothetical protein
MSRVSYHLGQPMSLFCHNYQPLQAKLGILTLRNRRIISDMLFLRNLINGDICCPEILALIGFYSPGRSLRHFSVFHVSAHRTSYGKFKPINRLCMVGNEYADRLDFFNMSYGSFKNRLIALLSS